MLTFASARGGYAALWQDAEIRPEHRSEVTVAARRIIANRARYEPISKATGVPWFLIGIIHAMECDFKWDRHLHNGDPLARRTVNKPKGRPAKGDASFTFDESAIDALRLKKLDQIRDWSVERIAWCLETYNGWGYRPKDTHSPYLWSFTTAYVSGKFVVDGVWSAAAVSKQCGGMAILKVLLDLDPVAIDLRVPERPAMATQWAKADMQMPGVVGTVKRSGTVWSAVGVAGAVAAPSIKPVLPEKRPEQSTAMAPAIGLGAKLRANIDTLSVCVIGVLLAVIIARHVRDKRALLALRGD